MKKKRGCEFCLHVLKHGDEEPCFACIGNDETMGMYSLFEPATPDRLTAYHMRRGARGE